MECALKIAMFLWHCLHGLCEQNASWLPYYSREQRATKRQWLACKGCRVRTSLFLAATYFKRRKITVYTLSVRSLGLTLAFDCLESRKLNARAVALQTALRGVVLVTCVAVEDSRHGTNNFPRLSHSRLEKASSCTLVFVDESVRQATAGCQARCATFSRLQAIDRLDVTTVEIVACELARTLGGSRQALIVVGRPRHAVVPLRAAFRVGGVATSAEVCVGACGVRLSNNHSDCGSSNGEHSHYYIDRW